MVELEARNTGEELRVVLIFDISGPKLRERALIARLMEAVDSCSGGEVVQWN